MNNADTGRLLSQKDINLHRGWFKEMCSLVGIKVFYRAPRPEFKQYTQHGELDAKYFAPEEVWCIYDEHPAQKTMKMLGWNAELNDSSTLIHVPYDLKGLQSGALFTIPPGLDNAQGRVFKVLRMSTIPIYPASVACELGPVYENELDKSQTTNFKQSNFNLLAEEEEN